MATIIEPFRIKSVEPIPVTSRDERKQLLEEAGYNPFALPAGKVTFDFLTDSGTTAMSAAQWASMLIADEAYAGSNSFHRFEAAVRDLTGFKYIIPTHQGRAAEHILFSCMVTAGDRVPSNNHFDTTRANVEVMDAAADDLVIAESHQPELEHPFKGNVDLERLERYLEQHRGRVPLGMMTITNNSGGGQPVSLENLRAASELFHRFEVPFFLDACRFAENAYLIKLREKGQGDRSVQEIAREMFSLADGCTMSGKKDGLVNMGGFLATNHQELADKAKNQLILTEGFPTYGGCAARDLEAFRVGLEEVLDERYLEYRLATVRYLARGLNERGIPTMQPPGGHAVYIDAKAFLPDIPPAQFPGQALVMSLFLEGGIRCCEIGSVMFGRHEGDRFIPADMELVRLALPRRSYTKSHIDRVLEICEEVAARKAALSGLIMTYRPPYLPHFTARFEPVQPAPVSAS